MCNLSAIKKYMDRCGIEYREYNAGNGSYFRDGFSVPAIKVIFSDYEQNPTADYKNFEKHLKRCNGLFYEMRANYGDYAFFILTAADYEKAVRHNQEIKSCVNYFAVLRHNYGTETACKWFEAYINPESVAA